MADNQDSDFIRSGIAARTTSREVVMADRNILKPSVLVATTDQTLLDTMAEPGFLCQYNVLTATDASEALAILKRRAVDVMLADIALPQMSGTLVAQTAARMFPDMRVALFTDSNDLEAARAALGSGAHDYAAKPITSQQVSALLERQLQRRTIEAKQLSEERSQVLFSAIKALAAAIDAKSMFTATHSSRVTSLCLSAAGIMGLPENEVATLELAAQIHDIGKIGTPDEVLDKPGSLTDVEWVDILRHPDVGSCILSHVPALSHVASIVRHHHERYDGTGYPDGLAGDAIPLLSRIIAVADAYEAMTADRPYRAARSHQQAIQELRANARIQFDPAILESFVAAVDDMEASRKAA
jgi:putative two-component system response regulator